jgi:hypothetical protein
MQPIAQVLCEFSVLAGAGSYSMLEAEEAER